MKTLDQPINDVKAKWIASVDIAQNTKQVYEKVLGYFIHWITVNKINPARIKAADVLGYKKYLLSEKKSPYYVDLQMNVLKQFFKYLKEIESYTDNPARFIKRVKRDPAHVKQYLTKEMVLKLLKSIDRSTLMGQRDWLIVMLMSVTGMRCVEVSRLNIDDLKESEGYKTVSILGKGKTYKRELAIPDRLYQPAIEYIEVRPDADYSDPLFLGRFGNRLQPQDIGCIVKRRMKAAGMTGSRLSAHSLRHSAAINALLSGQSIYHVQQLLGHSSVSTTEIYLRAIESEKHRNNTAVHALDKIYNND